MSVRALLLAGVAALSACAPLTGEQAQDAATIQKQIVQACLASQLFKPVDAMLTAAWPATTIPIDIKNAGVDIVCANPAFFAAQNATTADWVIKNLAPYIHHKHKA